MTPLAHAPSYAKLDKKFSPLLVSRAVNQLLVAFQVLCGELRQRGSPGSD